MCKGSEEPSHVSPSFTVNHTLNKYDEKNQ